MPAIALIAGPVLAGPQRLAPNMKPVPVGEIGDWFSPDNYPPAAQRANRQGRVVVEVGVDSVGKAVTCNVVQSSGTTILDTGTCDVALANAHFNPATDRKGRPTAGTYVLPVRWVLPDSGDPAALDAADVTKFEADWTAEYKFDQGGNLVSCRILAGSAGADPSVNPCPPGAIGRHLSKPWVRDGRPVGATIVRRQGQTITLDP